MSRSQILFVAGLGAALIGGGIYGTLWILRQPMSTVEKIAPPTEPAVAAEEPADEGYIRVTLYVVDPNGESLATESQEVPLESSVQQQARQVVLLLLRRSAAIPEGTELREVFLTSQGIAYVDLSREVVANHPGGSSAEELTVFSLTQTLIANFPTIRYVKILVEGREVQTLAGHLDLTVPFGRAPDYLRPESETREVSHEAG